MRIRGCSTISSVRSSEILNEDPLDLLNATKQELFATKRELRSAVDAVCGLSSELAELRFQLDLAKDKMHIAQHRKRLILDSFTWKLGYLLMTPWRLLLRVLNIRGK